MNINKKLLWIYILSASVYFTQGIEGLPGLSLFFYLKEKLHMSPSTIMYLGTIAGIAWLIKPIWGYLCDNYLTKKLWILISLIGSLVVCSYLGVSPLISIPILIFLMFVGGLTAAIRDVAVDGIMCVEGKETNSCDKIQSIQWTAITIAGILVSLAGGYIADHFTYKFAYLCLIPIYLIIVGIVLRYKTSIPINRTRVPVLETICSYKELFTNKKFLLACLFIFLYNFAPGFGTPLMFIERDKFLWSGTFMGILGAIISVISIIGSILYFKFGKKINIEKCLFYSVFIGAITTLCYLYFTPISAIIYGIIFSTIGMFIFLNIMTFMAQSTIPGKEATSFALLCSVNNLAGTASSLTGAYLFPKIGLQPLIIVAALTSFLCLPIIKHLKIGEQK
jgi:predicted MFS family arabinose efflux permease